MRNVESYWLQELAVGTLPDLISLRDNHNNFLFEKVILIMQRYFFQDYICLMLILNG